MEMFINHYYSKNIFVKYIIKTDLFIAQPKAIKKELNFDPPPSPPCKFAGRGVDPDLFGGDGVGNKSGHKFSSQSEHTFRKKHSYNTDSIHLLTVPDPWYVATISSDDIR
jgi:hypothetical protein